MSVLKYFKNTPGRPPKGRQALSVIFFFKFATRSLQKKGGAVAPQRATGGACRPPSGDQWAQPMGAAGGPVAPPPRATGVTPLYKIQPPLPSSFEPENSTKNPEKKREVRRREAAKPCRIQHL